jgi:excisionase family DNA binding protein
MTTPKRPIGRSPVLPVKDTAQRLAVSDQTILNLIAAKVLKAFKVGRQWRVYLDSVEAMERKGAR